MAWAARATFHAGVVVGKLQAAFQMVEERRCDRGVAGFREAVRHLADMRGDSEYFLDHHHAALGLALRLGEVAAYALRAIGGNVDRLAHGRLPACR